MPPYLSAAKFVFRCFSPHSSRSCQSIETLADGSATNADLIDPWGVWLDQSGSVLIEDSTHRVRRVTPDGNITTIAGSLHYGGDNGPALSAYRNQPSGMALDGPGNAYIADAYNYRIRKVTPDGTISTYADGGPGLPVSSNVPALKVGLSHINGIAADAKGAIYLAAIAQVYKIGTDGILSIIAGTGNFGNGGDGGPATSATFENIQAIALDAPGNIYLADSETNRVRMINASIGIIIAFAGNGSTGTSPDGGLATSVPLNMPTAMAVDSAGNVYIADSLDLKIRVVKQGIISTAVGSGRLGSPDGVPAATADFSPAGSLAVDAAGNLYIGSAFFGAIYVVVNGTIHQISGATSEALTEGMPALSASFFSSALQVDANGDVYAADSGGNTIRKLILDTPVSFTVLDGDKQTAFTGQPLAKPLRVQLTGRAAGVPGVTVTFSVTPGSGGTLSASSTLTDVNGQAAVTLTSGSQAGPVVVTATVVGTSLPRVQFTEKAVAPCPVVVPSITSVRSASDFGCSLTFAPGSWLEIKGSNLAQTTRLGNGSDFSGSNAPTTVDGVSVTMDGKAVFAEHVSPGQLNVQAPADTAAGPVPVVVTTASAAACASAAFTAAEAAIAPRLLAPASFDIGGKKCLAALFYRWIDIRGQPQPDTRRAFPAGGSGRSADRVRRGVRQCQSAVGAGDGSCGREFAAESDDQFRRRASDGQLRRAGSGNGRRISVCVRGSERAKWRLCGDVPGGQYDGGADGVLNGAAVRAELSNSIEKTARLIPDGAIGALGGLFQVRQGFRGIAGSREGGPEMEVSLEQFGGVSNGFAILGDGSGVLAAGFEQAAQKIVRPGMVGLGAEHNFQLLPGFRSTIGSRQHGRVIEACRGVFRVDTERLSEVIGGFIESPA